MNFDFQPFHFAMASREKILAIKELKNIRPELMSIIVRELEGGNVIVRVQTSGENEIEVMLREPFHYAHENPAIKHTVESDLHYRGDFYWISAHAVVAPLAH